MQRLGSVQARQCVSKSLHGVFECYSSHTSTYQWTRMSASLSRKPSNSPFHDPNVMTMRQFSGTTGQKLHLPVQISKYICRCSMTTLARKHTRNQNKQPSKKDAKQDVKRRAAMDMLGAISTLDGSERIDNLNKVVHLCHELKDKNLVFQLLDQMEASRIQVDQDVLRVMLEVCSQLCSVDNYGTRFLIVLKCYRQVHLMEMYFSKHKFFRGWEGLWR